MILDWVNDPKGVFMNHINSCVVEGTIVKAMGKRFPALIIENVRHFKDDDGTVFERKALIRVECYGLLADIVKKHGKVGRGISVVGSLRNSGSAGALVLAAEHIEFKPMKKED
jgi:single-stranded DNA-binding protein